MGGCEEMLTSADKMGRSKKGQKHADVILEWSLRKIRKQSLQIWFFERQSSKFTNLIRNFYFQEFFLLVKHILRTTPSHGVESFQKWTPAEVALNEQLIKCTENVHNALCGKILF